MKFLKSLNSVIFLQHVKQLIILHISSYSLKVLRVITVLLFRLVDTGTGRRARRGWQGEVHTEDRLPGESKAVEGVRRNRQDTGQVFNVSSNLPSPLRAGYCFEASFQPRQWHRNLIFQVSSRRKTRISGAR